MTLLWQALVNSSIHPFQFELLVHLGSVPPLIAVHPTRAPTRQMSFFLAIVANDVTLGQFSLTFFLYVARKRQESDNGKGGAP